MILNNLKSNPMTSKQKRTLVNCLAKLKAKAYSCETDKLSLVNTIIKIWYGDSDKYVVPVGSNLNNF